MQNYQTFYEKISRPFRRSPSYEKNLNRVNQTLTIIFYVSYPLLLVILLFQHSSSFLKTLLVPASSFLAISLVRRLVNRPRPYEKWKIKPLIIKNTSGKSWPSRHIFSASVIAMAWLYFYPAIGIILIALSIFSAAVRVIGGVHYPSDTACGFLMGILSGLLLWLL